jgi:predicted dehydrogenase/threonine dehydrogenase-like Zn-dependent dehydrogenase
MVKPRVKTILQNYRTGELTVLDVPPPALAPGGILVRNLASLVSAGTERLMVKFARKGLLGKARERPDLVRQVLSKASRDGIISTLETIRARLNVPVPLGYSSAGLVLSVGEGVSRFQPGDRVACAGAGYASHAEVAFIPENLAVRLPEGVNFESATFTTLGAIALQGLRLAHFELGETLAVIGLGLLGILTVQLAKASGCRIVGMDPNPDRCHLAKQFGIDAAFSDPAGFASACRRFTDNYGADKVMITASTNTNEPLVLAGEVARDRAIVVAVGATGMEIPRKTYFEKELTFRISRSYGPGRYDSEYEEKGRDYPIGYVRWTENRNMQAFLQQVGAGKIDPLPLITHRFTIEDARQAYALITGESKEAYLGILLTYPPPPVQEETGVVAVASAPPTSVSSPRSAPDRDVPLRVGFLGAGQFAVSTLIPALKNFPRVHLAGVCTQTGVSAQTIKDKFGFNYATTDEHDIIADPHINVAVIATRHNLHSRQVMAALQAGKHVFVEKPLCLNREELAAIAQTYAQGCTTGDNSPPVLQVGYNRRFAPMARELKKFLGEVKEPLLIHYRVNAGYIPADHWVHAPQEGGGRIIGEVCHFVDFLIFLASSLPVHVGATALPNQGRYRDDNVVVTLKFANGSVGVITYAANGDKALPKERVEVFGGGATAVLDNFRRLELIKDGRRQVSKSRLWQDKGFGEEWGAFIQSVRDPQAPALLPFSEILATSLTTFDILDSLHLAAPQQLSV